MIYIIAKENLTVKFTMQ